MTRPTDELEKIIRAGGSISILGSKPRDELERLAVAATASGATLTLRSVKKPTSDLVRIAVAGKGHVVFEFD